MRTTLVLFLFVFHSFCCSAQYKSYKGDGADDILQYVPYASALTMKIAGVMVQVPGNDLSLTEGYRLLLVL